MACLLLKYLADVAGFEHANRLPVRQSLALHGSDDSSQGWLEGASSAARRDEQIDH